MIPLPHPELDKLYFEYHPIANARLDRAYEAGWRKGRARASRRWLMVLALLLVAAFALGVHAHAQQTYPPFNTSQINSDLFVGQIGYSTIQAAVTAGCSKGTGFRVVVPAGSTPSDTPAAATGCSSVNIADQRTAISAVWTWNGTSYLQNNAYVPSVPGLQGVNLPASVYQTAIKPSMATWQHALDNCRGQVVILDYFWDSRGVVSNPMARLANNNLPLTLDLPPEFRHAELMRKDLQARCPSAGTGARPLIWGMTTTAPNPEFFSTSASLSTSNILGPYFGSYAGLVALQPGQVVTYTDPVPGDTPRLRCATTSSSVGITVTVDGGTAQTACGTQTSNPSPALWTGNRTYLGTHTATFANTAATGVAYLYAAEWTAGKVGVRINNYSVGSAPLEWFAQFPATQFAFADLEPAHLAITNMETNEPGNGVPVATYQASLNTFLAHEKALATGASVLLVAPLQDSIGGQAPYYPILVGTGTLLTNGVGFLDMRDGVGSTLQPRFFGPDQAHENTLGNQMEYEAIKAATTTAPTNPLAQAACVTQGPNLVVTGWDAHGAPVCGAPDIQAPRTCGQGYANSALITVPRANVTETLYNFPLYLSFNGNGTNSITYGPLKNVGQTGGGVQNTSGTDIIFCTTATAGVQLAHELTNYVPATGALEAYVRLPVLSRTADTTVQMFWGQGISTPDTSRAADVWSNSYAAVYHFGPTPGFYADSTRNGNTLVGVGTGTLVGATGPLGYDGQMAATRDLITAAPVGFPKNAEARTTEFWMQTPAPPASASSVFLFNFGDYNLEGSFGAIQGGNVFAVQTNSANPGTAYTLDSTWHQYVMELAQGGNTAQVGVWIDGTQRAITCGTLGCSTSFKTQPAPWSFNGYYQLSTGALAQGVAMNFDEVRVSTVDRSPGWIAAEYANFTNPGSFMSIGVPSLIKTITPALTGSRNVCVDSNGVVYSSASACSGT